MRQILFFCLFGFFISCDDGDIQIETLDFDSASIDMCQDISITTSNIFFKINSDEALILTLASGLIKNEVTTEDIISAVPGGSQITYRIFSGNVTNNYFCDDIPTTTPTVIDEIVAEDGEVIIKTILLEDGVTYQHTIQLTNISLVKENGSRITDLSINDYGTVTTTAN